MMSDYVPEAADTLAVAMPQPTTVDDTTATIISEEAQVQQKQHEDAPAEERMDEDDDESKENVAPTSANVVAQSPGGPGTPTKRKHKSGRIGKRELLQVASPKARWLPRVQEKRRGRSINRFEFEEKEVQPLWEGEGRKLEDSELVVDNIKFFSRNDTFLKQVHQIFYNRACKANEVKANLIAFSGLPVHYQGKAQEKLEAKSVSFLKLLADVLGVAHGEDGKKKTLVADLVTFLAAPRKVRRGVNLAEKAEALKEQRRAAKEKKEKKAKRTSTGGKDKSKKKDKTKKKPKAKASDFYSDIESDDEDEEDMDELYKWDKKTQAKNEAEAKQTLDRIAEREAAELQKKLDRKKNRNKNKGKASDEDDDDEESDDESEDEKAKAKRKKEKEKKRRREAEKEKEKEKEKRRRKKAREEEERKKRKIVKAKRKHEERTKADSDDDEEDQSEEEEEEKAPKSSKRSRAEVSDDDDRDDESAGEEAKAQAQAQQEGSSRKRRKIAVASDDEDEDDEAAGEVAGEPAADKTNQMQIDENKKVEEKEVEAEEVKKVEGESEEEKERREKTEKTQEAIRETLRRYLKEQLTVEEARLQTPKLLRLHVEAALGHSVEEHSTFILQCVRQLFTTTAA